MRKKLFIWLTNSLKRMLSKLYRKQREEEHQKRLTMVREFLHETFPLLNEQFANTSIIEGGLYNYFILPSQNLPKYDFVLPEIPLFIVIPGPESASWLEAKEWGIPKEVWDSTQLDLGCIELNTPALATISKASMPKLLIIRWQESINHLTLAQRIESLI